LSVATVLAVVLSAVVITVGAELLVRGASALALRFGVSPLFVGLTIVGFGTSSPELAASLSATLAGTQGVSVGNVVGSNIFNIAVILGITALIRPIPITFDRIRTDVWMAIAVAVLPLIAYALFGAVNRPLGALCLLGLALYLVLGYLRDRRAGVETQEIAEKEIASTLLIKPKHWLDWTVVLQAGYVVAGLAMLIAGSSRFVHAATEIATAAGVSELVIGLTLVAVGTSLPELVTSIVAAARGNSDIAVGNVIGSNIFNILGILGVCAVVTPQPLEPVAAYRDFPAMLLVSLLLLPLARSGGRISRMEGAILLALYVAYSGLLFVTGTD
jgi:cation:H+ antiporter